MFIAIPGTFHVKRSTPDGGSLHFQAPPADNWNELRGQRVRLKSWSQARVGFMKDHRDIAGFRDYLKSCPDSLLHLPMGRRAHLVNLVEVWGASVRLTAAPEDLIFSESEETEKLA